MNIELKEIPICDLVDGYENNQDEGVYGYGGKLNIRPKYQREFVYGEKEQKAVINSVFHGFPLNVMYWVKKSDGTFEVLDGQQRTLSICSYADGDFSFEQKGFWNLTSDKRQEFLDYKLLVYQCEGSESEILDWFKVINIAGLKLTDQEMRNAVYTGEWLTDAKRYFSKNGCIAAKIGDGYVKGEANRQALLELALKWISNGDVENYMAKHQHDPNANELKQYYRSVIDWVSMTFVTKYKQMISVNWGELYDRFKDEVIDTNSLDKRIKDLMIDDDVTNKTGIFNYVLTGDERKLNIRAFTDKQKQAQYIKQNGICVKCRKHFEIDDMEGDHIIAWSQGGHTTPDNLQMLCKKCNNTKSDI